MPVNNNFTGVFKTILVQGNMTIAKSANNSQDMEVTAVPFIQGTPKNRILDIGGITEKFTISAPILVGGGSRIDGRVLINERLNNILTDPASANLPILERATITINNSGSDAEIQLLSDGIPPQEGDTSPRPFAVTSLVADQIIDPASGGNSKAYLDPDHPLGPTRKARWYDFRVNLAGFIYYVMEGSLTIEVGVEKIYFIQGKVDNNTLQLPIDQDMIDIAAGTQHPNFAVKSIAISGRGKAAVLFQDSPTDGDYTFEDYDYGTIDDDSVNFKIGPGQTNVTAQAPGVVSAVNQDFAIEIWGPTDETYNTWGWNNIFPTLDLSKSVVSTAKLNVSEGVITTDFDFKCWVK